MTKKHLWFVLMVSLLMTVSPVAGQLPSPISLKPMPQDVRVKGFNVQIDAGWCIVADENQAEDWNTAIYLRNRIQTEFGITLSVCDLHSIPDENAIVLGNPIEDSRLATVAEGIGASVPPDFNDQGYKMEIENDLVLILGDQSQGIFYGAITLILILRPLNSQTLILPALSIDDWPDLEIRGAHTGTSGEIANLESAKDKYDQLVDLKANMFMVAPTLYKNFFHLDLQNESSLSADRTNREVWNELFEYGSELYIDTVPCIGNFGVAESIVVQDPHCAEGVRILYEPFEFDDNDIARPVIDSALTIINPGFEIDENGDGLPDGWVLTGNGAEWELDGDSHGGNYSAKVSISCVSWSKALIVWNTIMVEPDTAYCLTFYAKKSENSTGGYSMAFRIAQQTAEAKDIVENFKPVESYDWQKHEFIFVTQPNCSQIYLSASIVDGMGTFWLDDLELKRMNGELLNVVRTESSGIEIWDDAKTIRYEENVDFEVVDGKMEYPYDQEGPPTRILRLEGGHIEPDEQVLVSYDSVLAIKDAPWRCSYSPSEPRTYAIYFDALSDTTASLDPKYINTEESEIFGMNRDSRSRGRDDGIEGPIVGNAKLLAEDIARLNHHIHSQNPDVKMMVYDDMLSPWHFGGRDSTQMVFGGPKGETSPALDMIDKDIILIDWWYGADDAWNKMAMSPHQYDATGFKWLAMSWYDRDNIDQWVSIANRHENCLGLLSSTWESGWDELFEIVEETAEKSWASDPIIYSDFRAVWNMDEGIGNFAFDATLNNFNGELCLVNWVDGISGKALEFNGTSSKILSVGEATATGTAPLSVTAWIKTSLAGAMQTVIQQAKAGETEEEYSIKIGSNGRIEWRTKGDATNGFDFQSVRVVNDGAWHFVAGVRESDGTGKIYIDGESDNQQIAPPMAIDSANAHIGYAYLPAQQHFFDGVIDEVKIYNKALLADEIKAEYNRVLGRSCRIVSQPLETVVEDVPVSHSVSSDGQECSPSYSLVAGPLGASLDSETGLFSWTPGQTDVGTRLVTFEIEDEWGNIDYQSFEVEVSETNDPPTIVSGPIASPNSLAENRVSVVSVKASDEEGDPLEYAWGASGGEIRADGPSAVFIPPNVADDQRYTVHVTVSDGNGGNIDGQVELTVEPVDFAEKEGARYGSLQAAYDLASDGDVIRCRSGDNAEILVFDRNVNVSIEGGCDESFDPASGRPTSIVGSMIIEDGGLVVSGIEIASCPSVNEENTPPRIYSTPKLYAAVGKGYVYQVQAADIDGDELTFTLENAPEDMNIDESGGAVEWTPSGKGEFAVTVKVEDGVGGMDDQTFTVLAERCQSAVSNDEETALFTDMAWDNTLGYRFVPQKHGMITRLGGLFNGTKTVSLWKTDTKELIAEAEISAANDWQYVRIDPVCVKAGTSYTVGAYMEGSGAAYAAPASFPQFRQDITIFKSCYAHGDSMPENDAQGRMVGLVDVGFEPYGPYYGFYDDPSYYGYSWCHSLNYIGLVPTNFARSRANSQDLDILANQMDFSDIVVFLWPFLIDRDENANGRKDIEDRSYWPSIFDQIESEISGYENNITAFFMIDEPYSKAESRGKWAEYDEDELNAENIRNVLGGDFNGDQIDDLAILYSEGYGEGDMQTILVNFSSGTGFTGNRQWFGHPIEWFTYNCVPFSVSGDFNDDGLQDIAMLYDYPAAQDDPNPDQKIFVWLSTGSSFADYTAWYVTNQETIDFERIKHALSGDFTGDGVDDLCFMYDESTDSQKMLVLPSDGSRFTSAQTWFDLPVIHFSYDYVPYAASGKFDGDNFADVALLYDYPGDDPETPQKIFVLPSAGTGFPHMRQWFETTKEKMDFDHVISVLPGDRDAYIPPKDENYEIDIPYEDLSLFVDYPDSGNWRDTPQREIVLLSAGSMDEGGFINHSAWFNTTREGYDFECMEGFATGDFSGNGLDDVAFSYRYKDSAGQYTGSTAIFVARSTGLGATTNKAFLEELIGYCKSRFPEIPVTMCFSQQTAIFDETIPENIDWITTDPYPFYQYVDEYPLQESTDRYTSIVSRTVHKIQTDYPFKPIMLICQGFSNSLSRFPNAQEAKWYYDTVKNYGLLGLMWFRYDNYPPWESEPDVYGSKNNQELLDVQQAIGNEIVNGIPME